MTDQELAKAIADAVVGIWPNAYIEIEKPPNRMVLLLVGHDRWYANFEIDRRRVRDCVQVPFPARCAAAILLQELAQRQDGAEATWAIQDALKRYDESKRKGV